MTIYVIDYLIYISYLLASMCQWYILSFPYLISQINPELGNWRDIGDNLANQEEDAKGFISILSYCIKISPIFYFIFLPTEIGRKYTILLYLLGFPLAFVMWFYIFRSNTVLTKTVSLIIGIISFIAVNILTLSN